MTITTVRIKVLNGDEGDHSIQNIYERDYHDTTELYATTDFMELIVNEYEHPSQFTFHLDII